MDLKRQFLNVFHLESPWVKRFDTYVSVELFLGLSLFLVAVSLLASDTVIYISWCIAACLAFVTLTFDAIVALVLLWGFIKAFNLKDATTWVP